MAALFVYSGDMPEREPDDTWLARALARRDAEPEQPDPPGAPFNSSL